MKRRRTDVQLPLVLCEPRFEEAWEKWKRYRIERGAKLTPTTQQMQLDELSRLGIDESVRRINRSILQGWIGLFDTPGKAEKAIQPIPNAACVKKYVPPPPLSPEELARRNRTAVEWKQRRMS